ncbi:mechanosensitive ion channel family protein [Lyngbya aestuarii BL J]|uniref:Mechanosensitive ion channel family protein n=1 Tax=Lyngbya aestuarii BL J TaxID=1348334 RepID=U7QHB2_9CYAN|nr:mechanosensitive ion channel family protein [Lyngbya aestuarii]ERT07359.1 mechanosensitive ion channel family protein [Lyngbya aestuarii BL J]
MLLGYFLAQINNDNGLEKASDILSEITTSKIIQALIILAITYVGMFAIDKLIHWLAEEVPLRFRLSVKQSLPFWRAFLLGLAIILLIRLFLKLSSNNVLALTGTVAVALGFAFKDYISSVIAGIIALFERPYQVGDRVKIGDEYGEIVDYGLRGIRLQTPDDNIVSIPHNKIWTEAISNSNKGDVEAQVVANFYFEHNVDVDKVIKILYRVAYTSKYTQLMLPVLVIMDEKPWVTNFKLKCYPIDARDEFIYKTDLIKRAKQTFAKQGISYPMLSPQSYDLLETD